MKIYRVINKDGKGFYQSWSDTPPVQYWFPIMQKCNCLMRSVLLDILHPRLKPGVIEPRYQFAFTCEEDLLSWFPPAILECMNGTIVQIEIDEQYVIEHPKQCMYDKDHVISTVTIDKTQYYKDISFPSDDMWMWK